MFLGISLCIPTFNSILAPTSRPSQVGEVMGLVNRSSLFQCFYSHFRNDDLFHYWISSILVYSGATNHGSLAVQR